MKNMSDEKRAVEMTEDEKMVWSAAFAQSVLKELDFYKSHGNTWDEINEKVSGYNSAEIADIAVEKFREALAAADAEYLTANGHLKALPPKKDS